MHFVIVYLPHPLNPNLRGAILPVHPVVAASLKLRDGQTVSDEMAERILAEPDPEPETRRKAHPSWRQVMPKRGGSRGGLARA